MSGILVVRETDLFAARLLKQLDEHLGFQDGDRSIPGTMEGPDRYFPGTLETTGIKLVLDTCFFRWSVARQAKWITTAANGNGGCKIIGIA